MMKHLPALRGLIATVSVSLLALAGCEKSVDLVDVPPVEPAGVDATGGTWSRIVLTDSLVPVPEPVATTSEAYQQGLAEIRSMQGSISDAQNDAIRYWSAGAVTRWNDIFRGLIAKYNVAPAVGAPANPDKPFTNPPVTTRMLAAVSVAQYDALVNAWNARYAFNRPAPYVADPSIKRLAPALDAPTYPSEHAVVGGATAELLGRFFPLEKNSVEEKLREQIESRIRAGLNTRDEMEAGEELGRAVARIVAARIATDRAKDAAAGTPPEGSQYWRSIELPTRPPMLPGWGKVRPWLMSSGDQFRPGPPPAIGSPAFEKDLQELRDLTKNRTREQWRIADLWADGGGTSTPPGHWNQIACDLIRRDRFNELRAARAMALLNMSMMDAGISCWDAKYFYWVPRPSQIDPSIKVATGIPNFPSYTSGHSSFSGAAAEVLSYLFPGDETTLRTWAEEAALSRVYGCIHYRFDCEEAVVLGGKIGALAVEKGRSDGSQ